MRMYLRLTLFISLITALGISGSQARSAVVSESRISSAADAMPPAQTQADFDLMRKALEEAHSGLYRYGSKAEMDRTFAAERSKLNRPLSKSEFMAVLVETLAQIRCGYTGLTPDEETQKDFAAARMFPLRMMVERGRLIVLFNDTPDDKTIRPGMEDVEITRHKAGDILQ